MPSAKRLAISAFRNELFMLTIRVAGLDLTGTGPRAQVRLYASAPGDPLIDLATVTTTAAEGVKIDKVQVEDGVTVSYLIMRINKSTMEDASEVLPYGGEPGTPDKFAWALQWDGATRLYGDFWAVSSAMDSDSAPSGRVATYAGAVSAPAVAQSLSVSVSNGDVIGVTIDDSAAVQAALTSLTVVANATLQAAAQEATRSDTAADRSEAARDILLAASVDYPSKADAESGSAPGDFFTYRDAGGYPVYATNVGGVVTDLTGPYFSADKVGTRGGLTTQQRLDRIGGGQITPLRAVKSAAFTESAANPTPFSSFDGLLYGFYNNNIYTKASKNGAWSLLCAAPARPQVFEKMADGDVVLATSAAIYKSSGWGTGSISWTLKQANSGGTATINNFSSAGTNGVKMIVGEYASGSAGSGWQNSKKAWATFDAGDTWTAIYDASARYPSDYQNTHIHGCCYDPETDRFFVVEGHSASMGIYCSEATEGSISWERLENGLLGGDVEGGQPTVVVPTPGGIVCVSDGNFAGLWLIHRADAIADMAVEPLLEWPAGRGGVIGFGYCWFKDPYTDAVYVGMRSTGITDPIFNPLTIFASNGADATIAWQGDADTVPSNGEVNVIEYIVVTPWNTVIARTSSSSEVGELLIEGSILNAGGSQWDAGGIMGGRLSFTTYGNRGIAVGAGSEVSAAGGGAIGMLTKVSGSNALAVGNQSLASGTNATVIGNLSSGIGDNSIVVGENSKSGTNSVVIGRGRDLSTYTSVVSIGASQTMTTNNGTGVGNSSSVTGASGSAFGFSSSANANNATAIGTSSSVTGANGTAIGRSTTVAGSNGVALGMSASAPGNSSTALGGSSVSNGTSSTAVGYQAKVDDGAGGTVTSGTSVGSGAQCKHASSIALGQGTITTRTNQAMIGARHLAIQKVTSVPTADANEGKLYIADDGSGKMSLRIVMPSGSPLVLATEA